MATPLIVKKKKKFQYGGTCLIIPELRRLRQEDPEFGTSLGYITNSLKTAANKKLS
jgi:hypothetical protein